MQQPAHKPGIQQLIREANLTHLLKFDPIKSKETQEIRNAYMHVLYEDFDDE